MNGYWQYQIKGRLNANIWYNDKNIVFDLDILIIIEWSNIIL